jgi:hypothetical protein
LGDLTFPDGTGYATFVRHPSGVNQHQKGTDAGVSVVVRWLPPSNFEFVAIPVV